MWTMLQIILALVLQHIILGGWNSSSVYLHWGLPWWVCYGLGFNFWVSMRLVFGFSKSVRLLTQLNGSYKYHCVNTIMKMPKNRLIWPSKWKRRLSFYTPLYQCGAFMVWPVGTITLVKQRIFINLSGRQITKLHYKAVIANNNTTLDWIRLT